MEQGEREVALAVAAVARVARSVVGIGGLPELGDDALAVIADALALDATAMYLCDGSPPTTLRRFAGWARDPQAVTTAESVTLGGDEWEFLVATATPLVIRERTGWVMTNPFRPESDAWLVLPLVADRSITGLVVGSAAAPLSLDPVAAATLRSIAALLSAGVETARLRAEVQRTAIQRERMRLAAELHDGLAQDLALAVRELAFLETDPPESVARASRERLRLAVGEAHRVVRAGLEDLTGGLAVAGLDAAIREVCERFRRRGLAVTVTAERISVPIPPAAVADMLRVLHEALTNVQRHADVNSADVVLAEGPDGLRLIVEDAGRGFDTGDVSPPGSGHFGLWLMRERALALGGQLSMLRSAAGGTRIELAIPTERLG